MLADGSVGWVRVLRADPPGHFEQAAIAGVRAWRFQPARAGGRAIECRMLTRVIFAVVDTVNAATAGADGRPMAATALLTLFFDPAKATCPGGLGPERDQGPAPRPQPRVSRVDEWPVRRGGR